MNTASGILTVSDRAAVRAEADRLGAAVGVRVVHSRTAPVQRRVWSAALAVILDRRTAERCARRLPRRDNVFLVADGSPGPAEWQAAVTVGACRVVPLPAAAEDLVPDLAAAVEASDVGPRGRVIAVLGGRGGAGASLFAFALADTADDALLVDLDPWGGGMDLLAGTEDAPGLRWPDLPPPAGRLSWPALREALPGRRGIALLSVPRGGYEPPADAVPAVIDAGRRGGVTVVCDLPRGLTDAAETALAAADLVVLVSPCDVRACVATSAAATRLRPVNPNIGLVVRGPAPGGLRAQELAEISGVPLLAAMRAEPHLSRRLEHGGLRLGRGSAMAAAARRVSTVGTGAPTRIGAEACA